MGQSCPESLQIMGWQDFKPRLLWGRGASPADLAQKQPLGQRSRKHGNCITPGLIFPFFYCSHFSSHILVTQIIRTINHRVI